MRTEDVSLRHRKASGMKRAQSDTTCKNRANITGAVVDESSRARCYYIDAIRFISIHPS